jgi:UDP-N-acetylmuramoyl-L-alanyl-D-glutamate--2,6-diaminopimelate ligase
VSCPISVQTLLEGWCDGVPDLVITGVALDSRRIQPGQAFVAVAGGNTHGMAFAAQARANGATVVIHDGQAEVPPLDIPDVAVPGLGNRLSALGARFYHHPSDHLTVAGVTGTNGKTSTAHYIAQAWQRTSSDAGLIGTIGYGPMKALKPADMTTPDPISLQAMLADCLDLGVEKVAMEVSSHALDQGRCDDVAFDVAVFTNLTRDHLDYHGSMEAYAAAKRRLFTDCRPRFAVVNCDDAFGKTLSAGVAPGTEVLTYGTNGSTELRAALLQMDSSGMRISISSPWGGGELHSGLLGAFNVSNLLATAGTLALLGMPWCRVMHQLEMMHPVPGRMHCLGGECSQPVVVVDYAHTPDALEQALEALRSHLHGRLVCVFGCGGDRDRGKRPMMAGVAERLADRIVLTTDNPRGEEPAAIFKDMLEGLERPADAVVVEDRGEAIRRAIRDSGPGDIVLVAGKGHEAWQEARGQKIPFSDEAAVRAALGDAA